MLQAMHKDTLWVNCSTVDPDFARQMADLAASHGIGYIDAPVTAAFLKMKHPLIAENNFEEHFPLCWMRKDLHLAADAAYKKGIALPALNSIKELYGLDIMADS